jgi:hypothetical protein
LQAFVRAVYLDNIDTWGDCGKSNKDLWLIGYQVAGVNTATRKMIDAETERLRGFPTKDQAEAAIIRNDLQTRRLMKTDPLYIRKREHLQQSPIGVNLAKAIDIVRIVILLFRMPTGSLKHLSDLLRRQVWLGL